MQLIHNTTELKSELRAVNAQPQNRHLDAPRTPTKWLHRLLRRARAARKGPVASSEARVTAPMARQVTKAQRKRRFKRFAQINCCT